MIYLALWSDKLRPSDEGGLIKSHDRLSTMFNLPDLPYSFTALEPYIDAQTMQIHHDMHHKAYVTKLNDALEVSPYRRLSVN